MNIKMGCMIDIFVSPPANTRLEAIDLLVLEMQKRCANVKKNKKPYSNNQDFYTITYIHHGKNYESDVNIDKSWDEKFYAFI
jgi:hypothetical protein